MGDSEKLHVYCVVSPGTFYAQIPCMIQSLGLKRENQDFVNIGINIKDFQVKLCMTLTSLEHYAK